MLGCRLICSYSVTIVSDEWELRVHLYTHTHAKTQIHIQTTHSHPDTDPAVAHFILQVELKRHTNYGCV